MHRRQYFIFSIILLVTFPVGLASYLIIHSLLPHSSTPIDVTPRIWRVGTVYGGEIPIHTFRLYNSSDHSFYITQVVPSCGCTVFHLERQTIPPHSALQGNMEINTTGKKGPFSVSTSVFIAGHQQPVLLRATGLVVDPVPPTVDMGELLIGQIKRASFNITSLTQKHLEIKNVRTTHGKQLISVDATENSNMAHITLQTAPHLPPGRFKEYLTLLTNDIRLPKATIVVKGYVLPRLVVSPYPISLGVFRDPRTAHCVFTISSPYAKPFTVIRIVSSPPGILRFSLSNYPNTIKSVITVLPAEGLKEGSLHANIDVLVNPGERRLVIPVYGLYLDQSKL